MMGSMPPWTKNMKEKVNLLQEIPFATQQAWRGKDRKGKRGQGQCGMQ